MKKYWIYLIVIILIITLIFLNKSILFKELESFANWSFPDEKDRNGKVFQLFLNMLAGIGVIIGLFVAHRRAKAMELGVEKQSVALEHQNRQIELTRKSQTDERFKNAIEHLGSDSPPVILGGVAELHQIAVESKFNYSAVVYNILCSYIRTEARNRKIRVDVNKAVIQTIVNYIFKGRDNDNFPYSGLEADLSFTNLSGIDLDNSTIENVNFSFCKLPSMKRAVIRNSDLGGAIFWVSRLTDVTIANCNLFHTFFRSASFDQVRIVSSDEESLFAPIFFDSSIENTSFSDIRFFSAEFVSCDWINCDFSSVELSNSNFYGSSFNKIDFSKIGIHKCNFDVSGFVNVKFGSKVSECSFSGCQNDSGYFSNKLKEKVNGRIGRATNLTGAFYDVSDFEDCDLSNLSKERSRAILVHCDELLTKMSERVLGKKKNINKKSGRNEKGKS